MRKILTRHRLPALVAGCFVLAACAAPGTQQRAAPVQPIAPPVFTAQGIDVGGTGKEIDFNRTEASTIAAMSKLMGGGPAQSGAACSGLRSARWSDGTTLYFEPKPYDPPAFVGWRRGTETAGRSCAT